MSMNANVHFIQISDIHLYADPEKSLLGVKTEESFAAVVALLKEEKRHFDFIFLSGDLTQDGSIVAYERLAKILKQFHVPVYYVPGNHDHIPSMSQVYPCENFSNQKHIILKHWHLILLNSQKTGSVEGYIDLAQLKFLHNCLEAYPTHHALIAFHHHPLPVGCQWLDNIGVLNADELWHVLKNFPNAQHLLFGHVHQEFAGKYNGVQCLSAPSTCIQFKRKQDKFGLEKLSPGYRYITLQADGALTSEVSRAPQYVGVFDEDAKGY